MKTFNNDIIIKHINIAITPIAVYFGTDSDINSEQFESNPFNQNKHYPVGTFKTS